MNSRTLGLRHNNQVFQVQLCKRTSLCTAYFPRLDNFNLAAIMAAPGTTPKMSKETRIRIIDLEESTWRALQKSGEALMPFITDDCVMQFPMGMKLGPKTEPSVKDILHSPAFVPWKTFELLDIDVQPVGDGAIISYLAQATRPPTEEGGRDVPFDALCCTVWRWDGEKFSMCFHQQTLAN